MTNHEAIQFLDNMKGHESGRAIGKDGFYAELCGYHVQALNKAIKALETTCVMCKDCKHFKGKDNYCRFLQINWLPDDFGCVRGEEK